MSYSPPSTVNYARLGQWYRAQDLSDFLITAEQAAFNVQSVRDGLRDTFNSIPAAAPFSSSLRFPDDHGYISGFRSNWNQLIIQMTTALSYKPGTNDPKVKPADSESLLNENSVVVSFYQAIKAMKELLMQPPPNNALFVRENFENFFRLTWTSSPPSS